MKCKDYYDILGLSKTASTEEIKKAYRKNRLKFIQIRTKTQRLRRLLKSYLKLTQPSQMIKRGQLTIGLATRKTSSKLNRAKAKILSMALTLRIFSEKCSSKCMLNLEAPACPLNSRHFSDQVCQADKGGEAVLTGDRG